MSPELLAPLMFTTLVVVLLAGFPVAFSLAAVAASFGVLGVVCLLYTSPSPRD